MNALGNVAAHTRRQRGVTPHTQKSGFGNLVRRFYRTLSTLRPTQPNSVQRPTFGYIGRFDENYRTGLIFLQDLARQSRQRSSEVITIWTFAMLGRVSYAGICFQILKNASALSGSRFMRFQSSAINLNCMAIAGRGKGLHWYEKSRYCIQVA